MSSTFFSAVRDGLASAFVRNPEGQLEPTQSFFIFESKTKSAPIDFLDEFVKAMAKEIGTSLISFGLEDLEDLGLEFTLQTSLDHSEDKPYKIQDKNKNWNPSLAKKWFWSSSETDTDAKQQAWERTQRSFSTLLDAIPYNQAMAVPEGGDAAEKPRQEQPGSISPVLVQVRETSRIMAMEKGWRLLGRLCDCIQKRRQNGQSIAVILTIPLADSLKCSCLQCMSINWKHIYAHTCASDLSHFEIDPINIGAADFGHAEYIASVNIRRMKRTLRKKLRHVFDPQTLHPHADWSPLGCNKPGKCFGDQSWSWSQIHEAFLQMSGRSFGKENLGADDILLVLSRSYLHEHKQPYGTDDSESTSTEDTVEEVEKHEPVEPKKQTWRDKMMVLRMRCNPTEQNLIDCVINPDEIRSSYSQVIIEEELKETVLHLVSSSYMTPPAPSTSLLSQARIKGILLYGPPGTGKTHLTRSIANESGASMLCVDCATLLSKYVGDIEKNIKAAFTLASKLYPCVLFIDEVDSLFYDRGTARRSWERSTVTQFLTQMDGLAQNDKAPCVIVATNRPDTLDKAFLRRLPQKIPIGLPDTESRSKILGVLLEGEELDPLVEIDSLARETEGYSGSDLRSLCAEAALIWAIEHSKRRCVDGSSDELDKMRLGVTHFAKALQRIRPSVSKRDLLELESFTKRFNPHALWE
ncbi:hypothetical protein N0V84_006475 [Fusarium piperis]|uniref:AAA+ ATPase domain-containing protein n=1 Tax=Fusarium piperis TaxID=1435070 RepID=A0A9W8WBU9_9HYPO|nr:hypothetical protein N0V84_006475 [Fusarium piperis]